MNRFFAELRRRRVWRVAGAYAGGAITVILAVDQLYDEFGLPAETTRAVIILFAIGLPIALLLAWFYEVRAETPAETAAAPPHSQGAPPSSLDQSAASDAPGSADHSSIAILPFANMTPDASDEYFADGMTEEIINAVAQVADLRVIARTSVFAFKGSTRDVREIGRELGVGTVLEGSIRRSGDRLRITAQLIDVSGGHHLWSERYDRRLADVFDIQDEIAGIIASRLQASAPEPREGRTEDLAAYEAYLRGMFLYEQFSHESAARALNAFDEALEHDPDYALAHAGAALAHVWLAGFGLEESGSTAESARAAAERALELEPDLPEGLMGLAEVVHYLEWDSEEASRLVRRATELRPGFAWAHGLYGFCLRALGRFEEAVTQFERAAESDPLNVATQNELGNAYLAAGRRVEAEAQYARTLELDGEFAPTLESLGWLEVRDGELENALETFESLPQGRPNSVAARGFTLAMLGRTNEARALLASLEDLLRQRKVAAEVHIARVHAGLGDFDEAARYLELAIDRKIIPAILLASSVREWGPFREDPRFQQLLDRIATRGDRRSVSGTAPE